MLKLNVLTFNKWNGKWLYINLNPSFSYQNTINSLNFFLQLELDAHRIIITMPLLFIHPLYLLIFCLILSNLCCPHMFLFKCYSNINQFHMHKDFLLHSILSFLSVLPSQFAFKFLIHCIVIQSASLFFLSLSLLSRI